MSHFVLTPLTNFEKKVGVWNKFLPSHNIWTLGGSSKLKHTDTFWLTPFQIFEQKFINFFSSICWKIEDTKQSFWNQLTFEMAYYKKRKKRENGLHYSRVCWFPQCFLSTSFRCRRDDVQDIKRNGQAITLLPWTPTSILRYCCRIKKYRRGAHIYILALETLKMATLQSLTGPVQGQNREFPV